KVIRIFFHKERPPEVSFFSLTFGGHINLNELFKFNGDATQISENTAQLTSAINKQKGAISGRAGINLSKDFSLDMDVNLGSNPDGADGIGIVFHKGEIGQIGEYGGGLGILGLPGGIGF